MRFKKNYLWTLSVFIVASSFFFSACTPEDDKPSENFKEGVLIINKGTTNGTLSHYNPETQKVTPDLFEKNNAGKTLGKGFMSVYLLNSTAYLISTDANSTVLIDYNTYAQTNVVEEIKQPRYFLPATNLKAYISSWGADGASGSVKVVDLGARTIVREIPTGKGSNQMIRVGANIWVANSGGTGTDSTIAILNVNGDTVVKKINVGGKPTEMVADVNGDVWVVAQKGNKAELVKIRAESIEAKFDIPSGSKSLITNALRTELFFVAEQKIWQKTLTNFGRTPPSVFISPNSLSNPQGLGVALDNTLLYCADRRDGVQKGQVFVFNLATKVQTANFEAGVDPVGFVFR